MARPKEPVDIVVDTREQMPWAFSPRVTVHRAPLRAGDYSLVGAEERFAIERKSVADLIHSLTTERDRFVRELQLLRGYEWSAVFVEGDLAAIARGDFRSYASPESIVGSCAWIATDVGVPVVFCGTRAAASMYAEKMLIRLAARIACGGSSNGTTEVGDGTQRPKETRP